MLGYLGYKILQLLEKKFERAKDSAVSAYSGQYQAIRCQSVCYKNLSLKKKFLLSMSNLIFITKFKH